MLPACALRVSQEMRWRRERRDNPSSHGRSSVSGGAPGMPPPPKGVTGQSSPLPRQNGCRKIKTAPSLVTSDTSAFDGSAYNTHMIIDAFRVVCPPGSLCSGRESVRRSVPSTAATAAGGFAAERRRLSRCRPTAAGTVLQVRRRSAATAGSVVLRDDGRGSTQNCGV